MKTSADVYLVLNTSQALVSPPHRVMRLTPNDEEEAGAVTLSDFPRTHPKYAAGPVLPLGAWLLPMRPCLGEGPWPPVSGAVHPSTHDRAQPDEGMRGE